jgi:hypothetical protein
LSDKEKPSISQIVMSWKYRHGERFYKREAQLKDLFDKMKEHGYDRNDLSPSVLKSIVSLMYLDTWKTAKAWKKCVEVDLERAVNTAWPDEQVGPWKDFDPSAVEEGVVKIERPEFEAKFPIEDKSDEQPEERLLDLGKMREGIELEELNPDALLRELGINKDTNGRGE